MARISKEVLEKLYGKMIAEKKMSIEGIKNKTIVEIYDGFAYCPDVDGDEFVFIYPQMEVIKDSEDFQKRIKEFLNIPEETDITVIDVLLTFNTVYRNGVKVRYDTKEHCFIEIPGWVVKY